eukprot:Rhum_TRINITY_DN15235_c12_g1::Rhum_TRINITY_DN15235_c12_g1_i1::g.146205::m.146205
MQEWVLRQLVAERDCEAPQKGSMRIAGKTFQGKSFGLFAIDNKARQYAIYLIVAPNFDKCILFLILVNTILIAIDDPLEKDDTRFKQAMAVVDVFFMCAFAAESIAKMLAMGVIMGTKHAYLRDPWNVVDFVIVVSGVLSLLLQGKGIFSVLRMIRVFRPLRSINRIAGMRRLVNTLFSCLPLMFDVVCLSLLVFYLFSLVGVVMWNDSLHHRCWLEVKDDPIALENITGWGRVCSINSTVAFFNTACPDGLECLPNAPAPYKFANFNHLGTAMLLVFQCVTLDGWITHSYAVEDGWAPPSSLFFIFLTMFGAYFFANLVLAVVTDALSKYTCDEQIMIQQQPLPLTSEALDEIQMDEHEGSDRVPSHDKTSLVPRLQVHSESGDASGRPPARSISSGVRGTQPAAEMSWMKFVTDLQDQAIRGLEKIERDYTREPQPAVPNLAQTQVLDRANTADQALLLRNAKLARNRGRNSYVFPQAGMVKTVESVESGDHLARSFPQLNDVGEASLVTPRDGQVWGAISQDLQRRFNRLAARRATVVSALVCAALGSADRARRVVGFKDEGGGQRNSKRQSSLAPSQDPFELTMTDAEKEKYNSRQFEYAGVRAEPSTESDSDDSFMSAMTTLTTQTKSEIEGHETQWALAFMCWRPGWRHTLRQVCRHPVFQHTVTGVIILNAIMMAIEFYDMPGVLTDLLNAFNLVITIVFLTETVLKLVAYGFWRWAKDTFNLFDAFVVIISLVELIFLESKAVSLFRVFRMFRVLRFLKLARSWKVLHNIVKMVHSSLAYIGFLVLLILLFMFIFAVLGRSLFAGNLERPVWCSSRTFEGCMDSESCIWQFRPKPEALNMSMILQPYQALQTAADLNVSVLDFSASLDDFNLDVDAGIRTTIDGAGNATFTYDTKPFFSELLVTHDFLRSLLSAANTTVVPPGFSFSFLEGVALTDNMDTMYVVSDTQEAFYVYHLYFQAKGMSVELLDAAGLCRVRRAWNAFDHMHRVNFDTLQWSCLHVFQILTRDNWALMCFRLMEEVSPFTVCYFLTILIFGTYLLFSMFIAILLVKLSDQTAERDRRQKERAERKKKAASVEFTEGTTGLLSPANSRPGVPPLQPLVPPPAADEVPFSPNLLSPVSPNTGVLSPPNGSAVFSQPTSPTDGMSSPVSRSDVLLYQMNKAKERKERLQKRRKMSYDERVAERRRGSLAGSVAGSVYSLKSLNSVRRGATGSLLENGGGSEEKAINPSPRTEVWVDETCAPTVPIRSALKRSKLVDDDEAEVTEKKSAFVSLQQDDVMISQSPDQELHAIDTFLKEVGADECYAEAEEDSEEEWEELEGKSFFLFSPTNPFRLWLTDFLHSRFFEVLISWLIILNCLLITLNDRTLNSSPSAISAVRIADWTFTGIFTLEILCRSVVHNCFIGSSSYLQRQRWNKVDFIIVVVSLISIPIEAESRNSGGDHHQAVRTVAKIFKTFRAFRPLRILVRTKRMKVVVGAFVNTIPAVFNVMAVAFVLYFIFGVAGVQLMQGAFRRCSDGSDRSRKECFGTWNATAQDGVSMTEEELLAGYRTLTRVWANPRATSFDNLLSAWVTLLEVAALNGWVEMMYNVIDSQIEDARPLRDARPELAVFFIVWIFAGAFFVMNIFTGVVVDHFTRQKLELDGSIWLTNTQEENLRVKKIIMNTKAKNRHALPVDYTWYNELCYKVVNHPLFPKFILTCVLLNVLLMAMIHHNASPEFNHFQTVGNTAFTVIFTIEMFIEMGVAGVSAYWRFKWYRLDLVIVLISWLEILVALLVSGGSAAALIQLLRLGRAFRLLRHFKGLKKLLMTLYYSIPAFYNIGSLLFLMFFIFSILGMALFEDVRTVDTEEVHPVLLSRQANFQSFPRAMVTLYRVATMDSWWRIVAGCQVSEPYCSSEKGDCGNPVSASVYFAVFTLCVGFVMMNLFIAIILENFRESVLLPEDLTKKMESVVLFREVWAKYDPRGVQYIMATQFVPLLQQLLPPIGLVGMKSKDIMPAIKKLDFPITWPEQRVLFADAVDAIGEAVFEIQLLDSIATRKYLKVSNNMDLYQHGWTMTDWYAASIIQTAWRSYRLGQPLTGHWKFMPPPEHDLLATVAAAVRKKRKQDEEVAPAPATPAAPPPQSPAEEAKTPLRKRTASLKNLLTFSTDVDVVPSTSPMVRKDEEGKVFVKHAKKHAEPKHQLLDKYMREHNIEDPDMASERKASLSWGHIHSYPHSASQSRLGGSRTLPLGARSSPIKVAEHVSEGTESPKSSSVLSTHPFYVGLVRWGTSGPDVAAVVWCALAGCVAYSYAALRNPLWSPVCSLRQGSEYSDISQPLTFRKRFPFQSLTLGSLVHPVSENVANSSSYTPLMSSSMQSNTNPVNPVPMSSSPLSHNTAHPLLRSRSPSPLPMAKRGSSTSVGVLSSDGWSPPPAARQSPLLLQQQQQQQGNMKKRKSLPSLVRQTGTPLYPLPSGVTPPKRSPPLTLLSSPTLSRSGHSAGPSTLLGHPAAQLASPSPLLGRAKVDVDETAKADACQLYRTAANAAAQQRKRPESSPLLSGMGSSPGLNHIVRPLL